MILFFVQFVVVLRYPCFTPVILLLGVIETWSRIAMGLIKPIASATVRPPPGAKAIFFMAAVTPIFFVLSLDLAGTNQVIVSEVT